MNRNTIIETIEEYPRLVNELMRLQSLKEDVFNGWTAQSLQKSRNMERVIKTERRIGLLIKGIEAAELNDLEEIIIDCRMDGMTMTDIAKHTCKSRHTIHTKFDVAIERIYNTLIA